MEVILMIKWLKIWGFSPNFILKKWRYWASCAVWSFKKARKWRQSMHISCDPVKNWYKCSHLKWRHFLLELLDFKQKTPLFSGIFQHKMAPFSLLEAFSASTTLGVCIYASYDLQNITRLSFRCSDKKWRGKHRFLDILRFSIKF